MRNQASKPPKAVRKGDEVEQKEEERCAAFRLVLAITIDIVVKSWKAAKETYLEGEAVR
jgi:hypothetical protein